MTVYNTDPSVDVVVLGADENDRVFTGAGAVPREVWDRAKDAFDKIHDPDYKPKPKPRKKATKKVGRSK